MSFRFFLFFIVIFFTLTDLFADATKNIVLAHMFPKESLPDIAAKKFKENLESSGLAKISITPAAQLGDERDNLRQLQKGEIELAIVGDLVLGYILPEYQMIAMPFTHKNTEEALAVYNSRLGEEIREKMKQQGIVVLSWHSIGQRMLTANKAIRSYKDLQGLTLRLPPMPVWMATWKALGAQPRAIPFPDLYDALKTGTVEAQENPPNFIKSKKFYEVQTHLMLTRHLVQRQFILASLSFVESLSKPQAKLLKDAARETSATINKLVDENEAEDIAWLQAKGGMTIINLDLRENAKAVLPQVATSLDKTNGKKLLNKILEVQSQTE